MFSPEHQQMEICLLKSNLEDIENDLLSQRSAIPGLGAEKDKKYQEARTTLRVARSLNVEIERLKQENMRLKAKRTQLTRQCEDFEKAVENALRDRSELDELLKREDHESELEIRKYEDALRDTADRFRNSRAFFCEEKMINELRTIQNILTDLKEEEQRRQSEVKQLTSHLESLKSNVPEDILVIVGKPELDDKLKSLSFQCDTLQSKQDCIIKNRGNTT